MCFGDDTLDQTPTKMSFLVKIKITQGITLAVILIS